MPAWITSLLRLEVSMPGRALRSTTTTEWRGARRAAMARPTTPAPTIATSVSATAFHRILSADPRRRTPLMVLRLPAILAVAVVVSASAAAQDPYQRPPAPIPRILDADPAPIVQISPDRAWLLLMDQPPLPHIEEVAAPELRLAGDRFNPRNDNR